MCFVLWLPVQATYQQQMSQGLRRWSRLGERCTRARRPQPAGAALCLFLRPASVIWWLVCLCWRSCDSGAHRRGGPGGCAVLLDLGACLHLIDAGRSAPPFLQSAPPSTEHPPHCVRQASIPTMVCGGGGGAAALAVLGSSELRSSELRSAIRAPRGCQGSRRCLLADKGVVKGRQRTSAYTCKHTSNWSVLQFGSDKLIVQNMCYWQACSLWSLKAATQHCKQFGVYVSKCWGLHASKSYRTLPRHTDTHTYTGNSARQYVHTCKHACKRMRALQSHIKATPACLRPSLSLTPSPLPLCPAGSLYLICRAVILLRGLCSVRGLIDVSIVDLWAPCAKAGLRQPAAVSAAWAAENAALVRSAHATPLWAPGGTGQQQECECVWVCNA